MITSMGPPLPPAQLGHSLGPRDARVVLGGHLDYVCPYSKKTYGAIRKQVAPHYRGESFRFVFHHQVQPCHPQSSLTHEAGLAVAKVGGEDAFWQFSDAMFERQEDFFDLAVNNKTRLQIHEDLAKLAAQASGVSQDAVLEQLSFPPGDPHPGSNISMVLKWYIKEGRQLGVHVSPTLSLNGLIIDSSSSWELNNYQELLDPLLEQSQNNGWKTLMHINF